MKVISLACYYTAIPLLAMSSVTSLNANVLLDENFTPGERLDQDLPDSSAWYTAYNGGSSDASGSLVTDSNRYVISYFTDSGSPASLSMVGDSIDVSISFSLDTPTASTTGFRIGLFDSGESRISADNAGFRNSTFEDYTGYGAFLNLQAPTAMRIEEREAGISDQLINGNEAFTDHTGDVGTGTNFVSGETYTLEMNLLLTAGGVQVSVGIDTISGYAYSYLDTSGLKTDFDTIVVFGNSSMDAFTIEQVTVEAIPEVSSAALATGLVAFSLVACQVRRRRSE
tara:strand:- start:7364 stop:8215 length:852 start_codon:yes stop_codon:yes gene_type:complete